MGWKPHLPGYTLIMITKDLADHYRLTLQLMMLGVCFLLPGCALVPPVVSQISWVVSGISYIATSKSPSDHAVSIILEKDCSLIRMLSFKPICVDISEKTNQSLVAKLREMRQKTEPDPLLPPELVVINQ